MGRLSRIEILRIHAVETDDARTDEVYYLSYLNCGDHWSDGRHPGGIVPSGSKTLTKSGMPPLQFSRGDDKPVHTGWGHLFASHPDHDRCMGDGAGEGMVSGPIFFFDSDAASKDWEGFGIALAVLLGLGVAMAAVIGLAPGGLLVAIPVALAAFTTISMGLALLWNRLLDSLSGDDYLGGVNLIFPRESELPTIVETHELQGARDGIRSELSLESARSVRWKDSEARYRVTFRATYL